MEASTSAGLPHRRSAINRHAPCKPLNGARKSLTTSCMSLFPANANRITTFQKRRLMKGAINSPITRRLNISKR